MPDIILNRGLKPVDAEILFENLTFSEKTKIVNALKPNFPSKSAEQLNGMRNRFAHWSGEKLRTCYIDESKVVKKYKNLSTYYDHLDVFILEEGGLSPKAAQAHIKLRNQRF